MAANIQQLFGIDWRQNEEQKPRNRSSIYTKVSFDATPKRNSTSGVDALQCVFLGILGRITKERWILWCGAGNCQEENQEVAEVSLRLIPSAALVIFMRLGSSLSTLPHQVRLLRVFFPLKIPLKRFDCNWISQIKSQYFCLVVWDLSLCVFPKVIWHSGSTHQSCLSYHKICFLSHSSIKLHRRSCHSVTQNSC